MKCDDTVLRPCTACGQYEWMDEHVSRCARCRAAYDRLRARYVRRVGLEKKRSMGLTERWM